jgi:hypothetical protein
MPEDPLKAATRSGTKSAWLRDEYRRLLQAPRLTDQEIDKMREHVIRLARTVCEHVWGKQFW